MSSSSSVEASCSAAKETLRAKTSNNIQGGAMPKGGGADELEAAAKEEVKSNWRCPDPGCKKSNHKSDMACTQCTLPRHSAHQFKRASAAEGGQHGKNTSSKVLKWL